MSAQARLRIAQHPGGAQGRYRFEIAAEIDGHSFASANVEFSYELARQDRSDLRWYLEDYLEFPENPTALIATRIERRMAALGVTLFSSIFQSSDAIEIWKQLRPLIADTRIEVATDVSEATTIPWELLRDPATNTPLALVARAFVRSQRAAVASPRPLHAEAGKVRILLVICRPKGADDVPFRSVASRLIDGLRDSVETGFLLEVLRPPTYEALALALRQAKKHGAPYHIVHFDGHGEYGDLGLGQGSRGYVVFESDGTGNRNELVDGATLGQLLAETQVAVLVLNACQSAYAEAPVAPPVSNGTTNSRSDLHGYGSLAQEVINAGAVGVVAMRYSVYVVTAARFVAALYRGLAEGESLGEAVTLARRHLADDPERAIAYERRSLQDWCVPVVYEGAPITLWPKSREPVEKGLSLGDEGVIAKVARDPAIPARPSVGFYGRDETLHAVDRAFDRRRVVLLHAFAGAGKTSTAVEFSRWYAFTGGVTGPVLFSSFERHLPLSRLLDKIGDVFRPELEKSGVRWNAITDTLRRREAAIQILAQIPALWIWDNIELIAGFPAGEKSDWSHEEQRELADFLRALSDTKTRVLLTSRRDELAWLGDLPTRVDVPPMPMRERHELAGAIAERRDKRLVDLPNLRPLLGYTQGNPLTILVLVSQALRDGLSGADAVATFIRRLRAGEAVFADDQAAGRTRSLGASLSYGFRHSFTRNEQRVVALLHLFEGVVNVDTLCTMGAPDRQWSVAELRGLIREHAIALLDRATDSGLLERLGGGYYRIHPALPWYLRQLANSISPSLTREDARTLRAFVEAIGEMSEFYMRRYHTGHSDVVGSLAAEEGNLIAAWRIARTRGWWTSVTNPMQGLRALYHATGRPAAWKELVEAVVPDFVNETTGEPLPGRDENWYLINEYCLQIAWQEGRSADAASLQELKVNWARKRATLALSLSPQRRQAQHSHAIHTLSVSLQQLGQVRQQLNDASCVDAYQEAIAIARQIGNQSIESSVIGRCARSLGQAYLNSPHLRSLEQAEQWLRLSLNSSDPRDQMGRANTLFSLGTIALERFREACNAGGTKTDNLQFLNIARRFYLQALEVYPENYLGGRAIVFHQLGITYDVVEDLDPATAHFQRAIQYHQAAGDVFKAGESRLGAARTLLRSDRFQDALAYSEAALENFVATGDPTGTDVQETRALVAHIRSILVGQNDHDGHDPTRQDRENP